AAAALRQRERRPRPGRPDRLPGGPLRLRDQSPRRQSDADYEPAHHDHAPPAGYSLLHWQLRLLAGCQMRRPSSAQRSYRHALRNLAGVSSIGWKLSISISTAAVHDKIMTVRAGPFHPDAAPGRGLVQRAAFSLDYTFEQRPQNR